MGTEKHGAPPFNFFEHPIGSCFQEGQSRRPVKKANKKEGLSAFVSFLVFL